MKLITVNIKHGNSLIITLNSQKLKLFDMWKMEKWKREKDKSVKKEKDGDGEKMNGIQNWLEIIKSFLQCAFI